VKKIKKVEELIKLDLGCGQNKREGFKGIDFVQRDGVDIVYDLFTFPWPLKDNSVGEAHCSHFFEHVPGMLRGKFMDELYRVMVDGAQATFITPYYSSMRAVQDFTHQWPPISETSYLYFNKGWRDANKLDHYPVKCDFDFTYGYAMDQETAQKNQEVQRFAVKHYCNAVMDLQITLTKRPLV
jgi:hypothetical protein